MSKKLPVSWLIPNMVTMLGLCSGLTAIRFALDERWQLSFLFCMASFFLDGMDGRLARMLKSSSTFGAQLDSLSDFLCFGVAPALLLYMWSTHEIKGVGWGVSMLYAACCALRLARFNTGLFDKKEEWKEYFFSGVPAPVGAGLALLPMIYYFQVGKVENFPMPELVIINTIFVGVLMASTIPTFSIKKIRIRLDMAVPAMVIAALTIVAALTEPWITLFSIGIMYYISIPFTIYFYRKFSAKKS